RSLGVPGKAGATVLADQSKPVNCNSSIVTLQQQQQQQQQQGCLGPQCKIFEHLSAAECAAFSYC
ncbi:unnamed protein product, partial [Ceratitis capitata]